MRDEFGIAQRGELDEPYAVGKAFQQLPRGLEGEARLPDAARTRERDEPRRPERPCEFADLTRASDETAHLVRQVVPGGIQRTQRGEVGRRSLSVELVDAFEPAQILEPMLAQIAQRGRRRQRIARELRCRGREQDLTAVADR